MTKHEAGQWIECVAKDRRVPKDVREMCADISSQLLKNIRKKIAKQAGAK